MMDYTMNEVRRKEYTELLISSVERIVDKLSDKADKISIFGSFPKRKPDLFTVWVF